MKKIKLLIIALAVTASAHAQRLQSTPTADSLRAHYHVEHCCAMTLGNCAARKPACNIAPRLLDYLTWADNTNRFEPARLVDALHQRYVSFADTRRPALDFKNWPVSGDANAPVTVWVYYSGTCPSCKRNFRDLHNSMTSGPLKGKAKMISKPVFPSDVNILLTAAAEMGAFPDIMLALAERTGRIDTAMIYSIAQSRMMDVNRLRTLAEAPATRKRVEDAEAESKRENVQYVPTYFINGRRYNSDLGSRWVIDAIEYEFDNVRKR